MPTSSNTTPQERALHASAAAHALHSKVDSREHLRPALEASPARLPYFERVVDPSGVLTPKERARRAEHARSAHFKRLALKSARARRNNAAAKGRT